jgi:phosphonate transport system permease protein
MPVHHRVSGGWASHSFNYAQTAAVLLMEIVILIVSLIGLGSAWLRERVI